MALSNFQIVSTDGTDDTTALNPQLLDKKSRTQIRHTCTKLLCESLRNIPKTEENVQAAKKKLLRELNVTNPTYLKIFFASYSFEDVYEECTIAINNYNPQKPRKKRKLKKVDDESNDLLPKLNPSNDDFLVIRTKCSKFLSGTLRNTDKSEDRIIKAKKDLLSSIENNDPPSCLEAVFVRFNRQMVLDECKYAIENYLKKNKTRKRRRILETDKIAAPIQLEPQKIEYSSADQFKVDEIFPLVGQNFSNDDLTIFNLELPSPPWEFTEVDNRLVPPLQANVSPLQANVSPLQANVSPLQANSFFGKNSPPSSPLNNPSASNEYTIDSDIYSDIYSGPK